DGVVTGQHGRRVRPDLLLREPALVREVRSPHPRLEALRQSDPPPAGEQPERGPERRRAGEAPPRAVLAIVRVREVAVDGPDALAAEPLLEPAPGDVVERGAAIRADAIVAV